METKLSYLCKITMGQSPKSKYYNTDGVGMPFVQGNSSFGSMYPNVNTYTSNWNKIANKHDILFTVRAPVGEVNVASEPIAIGRGIAALSPIQCNYKYLFYLLLSNKNRLMQSTSGTIYESINKNELNNVELSIHRPGIQQHIVDTI